MNENNEHIEDCYVCAECETSDNVKIIDSYSDVVPYPDGGGSCTQVTEIIKCENCGTSYKHIYIQ